ncbi:MAG: hypothetical protein WDZ64_00410 [Parcubacteria group bacterium]
MKKNAWSIGLLAVVILIILGAMSLSRPESSSAKAPEIEKILSLKTTKEQSVELINLMERVGPLEAQENLLSSGLPFTGETHLLVHTIGDYVYENYGLEGLPNCRDYFLSACYHGFILNALAEYGLDGMAEVMQECEKVGPGVAPQCAHGAGHGFVVWHDYNLVKGAEMCDALGEKLNTFYYNNCYDGVFMENVWGVHDGAPSDKRWVSDTDIYYPCTDLRIPEKYLGGCWSNQATLIYQHFKGDLKKTAEACDEVENAGYKETCYNNFSRQIHPLTNGQVERVFSLCQNATGENWKNYCINANMSAYWSVGDRVAPFKICEMQSDEPQKHCFQNLAGMIRYQYSHMPAEMQRYCDKIPNTEERNTCLVN